jgi:hypothetical protein
MQSGVGAFELVHYRDGALVRELVYGCYEREGEWERVTGTRQAWESWSEEPVVGDVEPRPDVYTVFDHYGLFDTEPNAMAKAKAKAKPKTKKPKPKTKAKAKAKPKTKPKAKAKAKPKKRKR